MLQTWSHWLRDKCSTYSSTRLTRGARVSWEADRTLQTDRGIEKSELASHIWHCVNNSCSRRKLDWEIWHNDAVAGSSNSASVMEACVCFCAADIQGYPWDHHLQGVHVHRRVQQLPGAQFLPSHPSLLSGPKEIEINVLSPWRSHKSHPYYFDNRILNMEPVKYVIETVTPTTIKTFTKLPRRGENWKKLFSPTDWTFEHLFQMKISILSSRW